MNNLEKADAILKATTQGEQLSPLDWDMVRVAQEGGLSVSGQWRFQALYENVQSGEYLNPDSPQFPYLLGIRHLTQTHTGAVYWKGIQAGWLARATATKARLLLQQTS